jgi:hypothetical protein
MEQMNEKGYEETQFDYLEAFFENENNEKLATEALRDHGGPQIKSGSIDYLAYI